MQRILVPVIAATIILTGCSSDTKDTTTTTAKEKATTTTEPDVAAAVEAFCGSANTYVETLNGFTGLWSGEQPTLTVGDVQDGVAKLFDQRDTVQQDAADLQAAVAAVDAQQADAETEDPTATTSTLLPEATADELIQQVTDAEAAFDTAVSGITASTPVAQAETEFTSAAYALEVSWSILLTEAGCIEDKGAVDQVRAFVASLQTDLKALGVYTGEIDGIYGPSTTAAVEEFQKQASLPVTGLPDPATQQAINERLGAQAAVNTAALQGLLAGLGLYTGPINGEPSAQLTAAVKELQAALDVPQTGVMDAATLRAYAARKAGLQALLAAEEANSTSTTTAAPTTAAPTTAAPATTTTAAPATTTTTTAP